MKFSELNVLQLSKVRNAIKAILKLTDCNENYKTTHDAKQFIIYENSEKPPTSQQKGLVEAMLIACPIFNSVGGARLKKEAGGMPALCITEIDEEALMPSAYMSITEADPHLRNAAHIIAARLLKSLKLDEHFWLLLNNDRLMIYENSKNPPTEAMNKLVQYALHVSVYFCHIGRGKITLDGNKFPCHSIKAIDWVKLGKKCSHESPKGMDKDIWTHMPLEIKVRWDHFNPALQGYLTQHIKTLLSNIAQAQGGKAPAAPVNLSLFPFPVNLAPAPVQTNPAAGAAAAGGGMEGNKGLLAFDLLKLLAIKDHDPLDKESRCHPLGGSYFDLKDILPPVNAPVERLAAAHSMPAAAAAGPRPVAAAAPAQNVFSTEKPDEADRNERIKALFAAMSEMFPSANESGEDAAASYNAAAGSGAAVDMMGSSDPHSALAAGRIEPRRHDGFFSPAASNIHSGGVDEWKRNIP